MERFYNSKNEKQSIYDIFRACRLCGAGGGYKMPIIHDINLSDIVDVEIELKRKIRECVSIEVHADDKMPPLICELCVDKVNDFYEFREMCRETNDRTRARLGLPAQTLGPSESEDCILGFTSPVYPAPNQAPKEPPAEAGSRVSPRAAGRGRPRKKPREIKPWLETPSPVLPMAPKTRRSVEKEKKVETPPPTPPPTRSSRKESRQPETRQGILKNSKASKLSVSPQPLLKEKGRGKREAEREREPPKPVKRVKLQVTRRETPPPTPRPMPRSEKRRAARTVSPPPTPKLRRTHAVSHAPVIEPFKCELCGAGYVKKSSLSNHMVSLHSPSVTTERLACTPCREWFASAEDAGTHHRWHKATATFYHCHACTADFKQLSGFNKHFTLKQCVPEHEVPDLQCAECWLTFPTATWMEKHNCGGPDARPGGECYKCRKKFAKYKQLSKHEESCIGKGKKSTAKADVVEQPAAVEAPPAPEEPQPRIQPVQIRMQRCDKLLQRIKREPEHDTYYDVSEVKPEFGLDKSCTYPYISSVGTVRIKTEPENHESDFITTDNIKQEIKDEVSYESDYLDTGFGDDYHSDGSQKADEQPAPRMVLNPFAKKHASSVEKLSTISLRTIFSGQFLGKIPQQKKKRKRKIKQQPLDDFSLEVKTEIMAEEEERMAAESNSSNLFDSILENRTEVPRLSGESTARDSVEESVKRKEESVESRKRDTKKIIDNADTASRLGVGESSGMEATNAVSCTVEDRMGVGESSGIEETNTVSGTVEDKMGVGKSSGIEESNTVSCTVEDEGVGERSGMEETNTVSGTDEDRIEIPSSLEKENVHEKEEDGTTVDKENEGKESKITLERDSDKSDFTGEKSEIGLVENNLEDKEISEKVSDESGIVFDEENLVMDKERTEGESAEPERREEKEADSGVINEDQIDGLEELNEIVVMKNKESAGISQNKVEKEDEVMNLHAENDTTEESESNMEEMEVGEAAVLQNDSDEDVHEAGDRNDSNEDVQEAGDRNDNEEDVQEAGDRNDNEEDVQAEGSVNDNEIAAEGKMDVDAAMEELEAVLLMGNEDSQEGKVDELPLKMSSKSDEGNELLTDVSSKDAEMPLVNRDLKEDELHRNLSNSVSDVPEEEMDFDINSVFGGDLGPVALKSTCKISTPKKLFVPEESKSSDLPVVSKDDIVEPSGDTNSKAAVEPRTDKSEEDIVSNNEEDKSKPINDADTVAEQELPQYKSTDEENIATDLELLQNSNQFKLGEAMVPKVGGKMDEAKEHASDENKEIENSTVAETVVQSAEDKNRRVTDEISDTEYDENELLKEPEESAKEQEDTERNILIAAEKVDKNTEHDILDLISDSGDDCNIVESPDKQTKNRSMPNDEKSQDCDREKISLDELLLASDEVSRLPESATVPKNDKNSMDLDSISDDEFDFDQN